MLGAQLLLKRAHLLGLSADFGARHLALQAGTANWQMFLTILEGSPLFNIDDAVNAANRTFEAVQSAFSRTSI
jgi:heme oxygenase